MHVSGSNIERYYSKPRLEGCKWEVKENILMRNQLGFAFSPGSEDCGIYSSEDYVDAVVLTVNRRVVHEERVVFSMQPTKRQRAPRAASPFNTSTICVTLALVAP